jgi:aminoglycoside phosphotransferase (APT) family kinase protein
MADTRAGELKKIAEGREAEMYEWGDGKVLRLLRNRDGQRWLEEQGAALEAARASGVRVPAVYGMTTVLDRPGMIMERIAGLDLLTIVGGMPWKVFWVADITGKTHARLNRVPAPAGIPSLKERLARQILFSGAVPADLVAFALAELGALPEGDRLCHGDFHPGNIMMQDGEPVVIDWSNVARGDPTADYARCQLMWRQGSLPPGTSVPLRIMSSFGRGILTWGYSRSYARVTKLDQQRVRQWMVPVAAGRLAEGIETERENILRFLRKAAAKG